ncbi:MAG: nucleotidyltransferase domain-containing protein [Deltaproteobacteria bacterium]|nr:nucleotidyltransferase domain-containing protein [Deltaproteobacteria bacterium]
MKSFKEISHIISTICSKHKAVLAAYLFGSVVKETQGKPSDIDIAVLLDDTHSQSFPILSFISSLEKSMGCRVDVVVLNRAGEVLKYEVRRSGKPVFERSPEARKRFEIYGRKTYEDFLFYGRKTYEDFLYLHKRYVNKVLYGGTNG